MENQNISQIALQRIKDSGIKPISKNVFNLKRASFWFFVGMAIIVGSISFSVTFSILFNNDWDLYNKFGFNFIFKTLPYFWFICLFAFAVLGEYYYRKTLFGYRHKIIAIIGIYIILTLFFGFILHLFRMGETVEQSLSENVPAYRGFMFDKNKFWSNPEEGLVSGRIISVDGYLVKIVSFSNQILIVNVEDAFISPRVKIEEGEFLKIIGDANENIFIAEDVRPWVGNRINKNNLKINRMR